MKIVSFCVLVGLALVCHTQLSPLSISLSTPAGYQASALVGDLMVFAGGYNNSYISDINVVNITSKRTVSTAAKLSVARSSMATVVVGNQVYFMGGEHGDPVNPTSCDVSSDVVDILTFPALTMSSTKLPAGARKFARVGTAGGPFNQVAIAAGGHISPSCGFDYLDLVETFPPRTAVNLTLARGYYVMGYIRADDSDIFVFAGGSNADTTSDAIEIYNATSGQLISHTLSLTYPVYFHTGTMISDRYLVVIGGTDGIFRSPSVEVFDLVNLARVTRFDLTIPRFSHAAAVVGPFIYVVGGVSTGDKETTAIDSVEVIDSRDWTSFVAQPLNRGLQLLTATSHPVLGAVFSGGWNPLTGYSRSLYFTACGNSVLDAGEVCDIHIPGCLRTCNGYIPSPSIQPPSPTILSSNPQPISPAAFVPTSSDSNQPGPSPPSTDSNTTYIIVGVVIGSVVIIGLIIFVIFFLRRKKSKSAGRAVTSAIRLDPMPTNPSSLPKSYHSYFSISGYESGNDIASKSLQKDSNEYNLIMELFIALDGKDLIPSLVSVTSVLNPRVATNFENHLVTLEKRLVDNPNLFAKTTWKDKEDTEDRKKAGAVLPAAHATSALVASQITETGFSALASLDVGYYGRGTYFSTSARYTLPYCYSKKKPSIMLCLTIPGNPYPVVEHRGEPKSFMGAPIQAGYQSNYVLTSIDGNPIKSVSSKSGPPDFFDELVLDQEAQVVPIAILEFDSDKLADIASRFQREVPDERTS